MRAVEGVAHYRTYYTEDGAGPFVARVQIPIGRALATSDHALYSVARDGSLRRVNKTKGTKKQRRKRRTTERQQDARG